MAKRNKSLISPLKIGDTVSIVAPASRADRDVLSGAVRRLKKMGFKLHYDKNILKKHNPFHGQTDEYRLKHLMLALRDSESGFVWCLRGGYGSNRLLPGLDKIKRPKRPKILLGYSDITSLHVFLGQKWGWPTIHGPLVDRFGRSRLTPAQEKELFGVLTGKTTEVKFKNLKPLNKSARKKRKIHGPITGGNLMTLQSTLGTPWQLSTKGKILFLEEIDERGYRVDRIFEHLKQAGALDGCLAVVLGDFVGGDEANGQNHVWTAVVRFAESMRIPVFSGMKTGHGPGQRMVPLHTRAVLVTGVRGEMSVSTGIKAK